MGKHAYAVILDAGSSGSRVYVYRYLKATAARADGSPTDLARLPEIKTKNKWNKKVHPGISTFGTKPEQVGLEHLKELVEFAADIVPKDEVESTPIFLLATAGMRLLPDDQRIAVLENVCAYFQHHTKFALPDCDLHIQVIAGETEGLYGWIAANYLLGGFDEPEKHDHGKGHHTYGFLDMGGASAQIAFAPNVTESEKHAEDLKLLRLRKVSGEALEYRVFVTTWLGFGANEARRRYVQSLVDAYPHSQELPDPCLPVGLLVNQTGVEIAPGSSDLSAENPHLLGTGFFPECLKATYPLLEKERPCLDAPCLLNGQHTPAIDFDVNHFVGVSEFWHTTHEVFAMAHKDKAYDFQTYQQQVTAFCSRDWEDIVADVVAGKKWGKKVDEKTVEEVCFKASWLINVLHEGIGVPRVGLEESGKQQVGGWENKTKAVIDGAKDRGFLDPFQAVDKIDGTEVSWTLGKMVLYASSQMPASTNTSVLPVGFGSNVPGVKVPFDFQYAAGGKSAESSVPPTELPAAPEGVAGKDWHDRIFNAGYARRVPGILIFGLILVLAVYLLCGRDRRLRVNAKLLSLVGRKPGKRPRARGGKLFGGTSPQYERVLEAADPDDFELSEVELTSSSSHTRLGRSSGWATPVSRAMSPDTTRASPKHRVDVDYLSSGSVMATTGVSGLGGRVESKEHLVAPRGEGARSRAGSPSRRGGPLVGPFKENVD
ncbi:hypothetical protein BAUCODRAFT_311656 [Baudoinia panamericana UAMH 10762]|uniref:Uncharacterized protein n=1 Tax=Baudoinia panamericana (strain UAMH 10762) TaxID=717646 RepID=M2MKT2_BAUPA|nr:uncharacterized protein BAUCODRAFT_311656 [Baudoinia panamericana UAMH 10762]EMC91943.1 hypothetical protein BAUCODRAFT_311656 [Baudoinia panamericana UAMH 10762]